MARLGRSKLRYFQSLQYLTFLILLVLVDSSLAFSPEEDISARAFLLMELKTGRILIQKEADLQLPPASTTKVLTTIVALESGRKLNEMLTVSKAATRVPASKLYLRPGQTISIQDLLYGVMLSSANDASVVLAEGIAGSVEKYAGLMTKKAHEIGATNTHFSNPHGLTAEDHYSTARDLAKIFRYAMRNPTFQQIVQTKISSVAPATPGKKKPKARLISVRNHNRLLWNFAGAIGGKTGYTHAAQKCFVGAVERNGVVLLVSVLGSRDLWGDTKKLLEYGFENYDGLKSAAEKPRVRALAARQEPRSETIAPIIITPQETETDKPADGFVLQVGSFRERERAELLLKQFSEAGFQAFLETVVLKEGETAYRVRVGPYGELLEAEDIAQELLQRSGYRAIILPARTPVKGS